MLTPAGQVIYREVIRIHQTAAEAIHHIHLPRPEAAPHTADQEVIQFLQEAPAAVQCPQDHTAAAAGPPHLLIAAGDQYQEAAAGPTHQVVHHQVVHHQEVLHQVVHLPAEAVAGEIRSRQITY